MMEDNETCFFKCNKVGNLASGGKSRIESVIEASIIRQDLLHLALKESLENDPKLTIRYHRACISTYTSKSHVQRELKRSGSNESPKKKKKRRSDFGLFHFKQHCLICGEKCLPKDPRHPHRWRKIMQCQTKEMKDTLLQVCKQRNDTLAEEVSLRISGSVADLHAADAQYHSDCLQKFMSKRNIICARQTKSEHVNWEDVAFYKVVDQLREDPSRVWNSIELQDTYNEYLGRLSDTPTASCQSSLSDGSSSLPRDRKERRRLINRLEEHFGKSIVQLQVRGCASLLCFRKHLPEQMKLVDSTDPYLCTEFAALVSEEIQSLSVNKSDTYKLGTFTKEDTVNNCSESLLNFVSQLVSSGEINRKSLSIAQIIQALGAGNFNQTTLGLALKIHHFSGSRHIIDILHSHGLCASYDEVRRFRKSAALFTSKQDFQVQDLLPGNQLVGVWFDNFDLNVCTPNGMRETHSMAVEFVRNGDSMFLLLAVLPNIPF